MSQLTEQVDRIFARWDRPDSPGMALAVVQDGQIVYARGYGMADLERGVPISTYSVFDIASTSKQFFAMGILFLANEGRLSLDDEIHTFLPAMPDYGRPITIRHLVHHTSGIRDYLELMRMAGLSWEYDYYEEEIVALLARQKQLNAAPGEAHLYSNSGYFLLGEILRRVSGERPGQFLHQRIFEPLGMHSTRLYDDFSAIVPHRAIGYTARPEGGYATALYKFDLVGDGGVLTTVEDLTLWDGNFYHNRLAGGPGLIEQMHAVGTLNSGESLNYAFGLEVGSYRGLPMVSHSGGWAGYSSEMIRFPEQHLSVICLANLGDLDCTSLAKRVADLYLAEYMDPHGATAETVPLTEEELAIHSGTYRNPETGTCYHLAVEDGQLVARHSLELEISLEPLSAERFRTADDSPVAFEARFEPAGEDHPRQMRLFLEGKEIALLEQIETVPPEPAVLGSYVGTYASEELNVTYRFHVEQGRLLLKLGYAPASPLEPGLPDTFACHGAILHFVRDEAGVVAGLEVGAGRAKGVWFTPVSEP